MSSLGDGHAHFTWNGGDINALGTLDVEDRVNPDGCITSASESDEDMDVDAPEATCGTGGPDTGFQFTLPLRSSLKRKRS
jgi:hypothetical protein